MARRDGEERKSFVRYVLRNFRHWGELGVSELESGEAYSIVVESPTRITENELRIGDDGERLIVSWRRWREEFHCTTFDQKDGEFVQMMNLLGAIDGEDAVLVEEFRGDRWIRSTIHAVKEDGQLGVAGSRWGRPKVVPWPRPTRFAIRSWKGSLDRDSVID